MNRTNSNNFSTAPSRQDYEKLLDELKQIKYAIRQMASKELVLELIQLVSPLFPQETNLYNASNEIEEAARKGMNDKLCYPFFLTDIS